MKPAVDIAFERDDGLLELHRVRVLPLSEAKTGDDGEFESFVVRYVSDGSLADLSLDGFWIARLVERDVVFTNVDDLAHWIEYGD